MPLGVTGEIIYAENGNQIGIQDCLHYVLEETYVYFMLYAATIV